MVQELEVEVGFNTGWEARYNGFARAKFIHRPLSLESLGKPNKRLSSQGKIFTINTIILNLLVVVTLKIPICLGP
jgi:hypothetical protein